MITIPVIQQATRKVGPQIDQELYERVIQFVVKSRRERRNKIFPESRLLHDLGVDGMDAEDFLTAFRDEFDIDFSGFDSSRHFGPEAGFNPFVWLVYKLGQPERLKKIPVTIMDLYHAAKSKKFPDLSNRTPV